MSLAVVLEGRHAQRKDRNGSKKLQVEARSMLGQMLRRGFAAAVPVVQLGAACYPSVVPSWTATIPICFSKRQTFGVRNSTTLPCFWTRFCPSCRHRSSVEQLGPLPRAKAFPILRAQFVVGTPVAGKAKLIPGSPLHPARRCWTRHADVFAWAERCYSLRASVQNLSPGCSTCAWFHSFTNI